VYFPVVKVAGA